MVLCDFDYCIYNKKGECKLTAISISSIGFCEDCLIPNISDEVLEMYKTEMFDRIERLPLNKK